jgi:hypothetical protein
MATRSLGTLTLDLIAKIGGFTQGMDQASRVADKRMREIERRANAFGRTIGSSIRSAGAQFLAFAGVSLTIGAAFEKVKGAIDLADETRDLSIRLGVSTEALSTLRYAAEQTGTDMDVLGKGMKILAKNAADAANPLSSQAKIFDALGISVNDSAGNLKQLDVLIPEIATKFAGNSTSWSPGPRTSLRTATTRRPQQKASPVRSATWPMRSAASGSWPIR